MGRRSVVSKIASELRRQSRMKSYAAKDRFINQTLYNKLKAIRKCQRCKNKIKGYPQIHHIIAKKDGGSNEEDNLLAVCDKCHKILDEEQIEQKNKNSTKD